MGVGAGALVLGCELMQYLAGGVADLQTGCQCWAGDGARGGRAALLLLRTRR